MRPTTFKCRQCGHIFISVEGDFIAPSFKGKKVCPKCQSGNVHKVTLEKNS